MERRYIGITLGPVVDTIRLSSRPATLWLSSYLFSELSKTLCRLLMKSGVEREQFLAPAVNDEMLHRTDGVGLFHDHIVFRAEEITMETVGDIRKQAVQTIAQRFYLEEAFLHKALLISAAEFFCTEGENPIAKSDPILACLELERPISHQVDHPLIRLMAGKEGNANRDIRAVVDDKERLNLQDWQLYGEHHSIRTTKSIANSGRNGKGKGREYYAMLRADGDGMGHLMADLGTDEEIRACSSRCLSFCAQAAERVKQFGGVTIYAGGDDLLALVPCEDQQGASLFSLMQEIRRDFDGQFQSFAQPPTLSFGVLVSHYKFPIYEALDASAQLLFEEAKSRKNGVALRLLRQSGRTASLWIGQDSLPLLEQLTEALQETDRTDVLSAMLERLVTFEPLLRAVNSGRGAGVLLRNLFDAPYLQATAFFNKLNTSVEELWNRIKQGQLQALDCISEEQRFSLSMINLLEILMLYCEKGGGAE